MAQEVQKGIYLSLTRIHAPWSISHQEPGMLYLLILNAVHRLLHLKITQRSSSSVHTRNSLAIVDHVNRVLSKQQPLLQSPHDITPRYLYPCTPPLFISPLVCNLTVSSIPFSIFFPSTVYVLCRSFCIRPWRIVPSYLNYCSCFYSFLSALFWYSPLARFFDLQLSLFSKFLRLYRCLVVSVSLVSVFIGSMYFQFSFISADWLLRFNIASFSS